MIWPAGWRQEWQQNNKGPHGVYMLRIKSSVDNDSFSTFQPGGLYSSAPLFS